MAIWFNGIASALWNREVTKLITVKWIIWWDLISDFIITSYLDSLGFIQHANVCYPNYNGGGQLCYLDTKGIILVAHLFSLDKVMHYSTVNWCNGEIISNGGVMMAWRFCECITDNFWRVLILATFILSQFREFWDINYNTAFLVNFSMN